MIDLQSCVDEAKHNFQLFYLSSGGQGAVFRTQYPNVLVKVETERETGQPNPANEESRKKFLALRRLPIPSKTNVTVPLSLLEDYSGYTMLFMEDMIPFADAFIEGNEKVLDNDWLEGIAKQNPEVAMIFFDLIVNGGLRRFWRAYLKAAITLAKLHMAGLVYCDFSFNNIFISKDHAFCHVWLIDADNLDFQQNAAHRIVYTPTVGAPELLEQVKGCTFYSDCYAFASTMFQQLTHHHPFAGTIYDESEMDAESADACRNRGFFDEPGDLPWVFDVDDDSNAWEGGSIYFELIAPRLMDLFNRNFSDGLFERQKRPSMLEWSFALAHTLDEIIRCPNCQMDRYGEPKQCSWCGHEHAVLVMRSSFESGDEFWTFEHELKIDEPVAVPMRSVHGFRAEEIDEVAFNFVMRADGFSIHRVNDKFKSAFSDGDIKDVQAAGFETRAVKFAVDCRDANNIRSRIEVKIFNAVERN